MPEIDLVVSMWGEDGTKTGDTKRLTRWIKKKGIIPLKDR